MQKKKVAIIGLKGLPAFGGAAAVGENIIKELKNRYLFTVYAISSHASKAGEQNGYYQIIMRRYRSGNINTLFYYIKSVLHCLLIGKYDIIHLHHITGSLLIPLLRLRYKVLVTLHGKPHLVDKWKYFGKIYFPFLEKTFLKMANLIVTVSNSHYYYYLKILKNKIFYIPNGVTLPIKLKKCKIPYNNYLIFAAGRIIKIKGCHLLLEALDLINYKDLTIVIGNLDHLRTYKNHLFKLSKNLDVKFIDLIKDKELLYSYIINSRFFIFPSLTEAMSMMLLEVASLKVPIICSDIHENKDIFTDSEVLFFRSGCSFDLGEKINFAINNERIMRENAQKAYKKLKKNYLWTTIASQYNELYKIL